MLLKRPFHGFGLAVALLAAAPLAHAGPKQCILSNNQAAEERAQRHLLAARELYLACAGAADCPGVVRDECNAALAELKSGIPSLSVSVVDDQQRDISDATLTIDGKASVLDGSMLSVDPGPHTLRVERGELHAELEVVASEGELNRRVQLVLAAPRPVAVLAVPLKLSPSVPPPPSSSRVPSYVLAGVGALGAGSFAYFALSGHAQKSDLERCKPYCAGADVKDVRTKYLIADISLGVSLVALGSAAYLWFRHEPTAASEQQSVAFDVDVSNQSALVGLRWVE